MKKIFIAFLAVIFTSVAANAEKRIGLSGAYTMFSSDGTETVKSSAQKNSKTHDDEVIVPSIFVEFVNDSGVGFGLDFIPGSAELGSATNSRTDTDTDDASDTAGNNKVGAELTSHTTLYVLAPIRGGGAYLKAGLAMATIETTETLATGTTYGNEDVHGIMIGAGVSRERGNGAFFRTEVTYTDYEEVTFNGSLDTDSVRNKIDGDVDALAIRFSIGKSF